MDGSAIRGAGRRPVLVVLAVLVLLGAVAIAAGSAAPTGSGEARRPADWLLDIGVSLFVVVMAFGAVLWIAIIVLAPSAISSPSRLRRDPRRRLFTSIGLFLFLFLLALGVSRIGGDGGLRDQPFRPIGDQSGGGAGTDSQYRPEFATVPVLLTLALIGIAVVAGVLAYRARRRPVEPEDAALAAALADVLDDTLDDIRAEQDPRRAVIVAYARFERVLAWYGAPRLASEAPEEYLERVLLDLEVPRRAVVRLTELFAEAKFSQHVVDVTMKEEAIEALETTRDVLRAVDERERAARAKALAAALGGERA